jgi:hypothetical protein
MSYILDFPVNVGSAAPLKSLSDQIQEVANRTKASQGELNLFKSVLESDAKAGIALAKTLNDLKNSAATASPGVRALASEFQKLSQVQVQSQNETQKWGRMMELAYQDNAKRAEAASARIIAAKKKELQEAEAVAKQQTTLANNLARATGSASSVPGGIGTMSLLGQAGGAPTLIGVAALAAVAVAAAAATKEIIALANETGDYAREQSNLATRTGLTLRETQEFSQMAGAAGVNVGSLTTAMRGLSKGLSENSDEGKKAKAALSELGLSSSVAFEPAGRAMKEIFERLGQMDAGFERDRLAIELFGRGGLELLPLIENFKQLEARIDSAGHIMDEAGIAKAKEYAIQVSLLSQEWAALRREMGEKAIGLIEIALNGDLSIGSIAKAVGQGPGGLLANWIADQSHQKHAGSIFGDTDVSGIKVPKVSLTKGMEDPAARSKFERSQSVEALESDTGTPRQRLEAQLTKARSDQKAAGDAFTESNKPEDLQKVKDFKKTIDGLVEQLGAAKKATESYADALAKFSNRGLPNEMDRRIAENDQQANALNRQFPKNRATTETTRLSNLGEIGDEARTKIAKGKADIARFQSRLQSEGEEASEKFYTEQIKARAGTEKEQKDRTLRTTVGDTGLTVQDFAQRYKAGKVEFAGQERAIGDTATLRERQQQIGQARSAGSLGIARASGRYTPMQLASMGLTDQLSNIASTRDIQTGQFNAQASLYTSRASNTYGDDAEKQRLTNQASEAAAKSKEAETKATIETVEALNKFRETAEEASAKIREQFGSFASGLVGAAREGHGGSYARNYMLGQMDKMVGNAAESLYKPGMLQLPGPLGKLAKGTMFGEDPKAHVNDALISVTDKSVTATTDLNKGVVDLTVAMAAVYQGLGGDPTSLGLTGLPALPNLPSAADVLSGGLSSGGSTSGLSTLALGGAAAGATAATSLFASAMKTVSGGATPSAIGADISGFTSLAKSASSFSFSNPFTNNAPNASAQPGWTGVAAPPPGGYDPNSGVSSNTSGYSNPWGSSVEAPLFAPGASTGSQISAGVGTAAAIYGGVSGAMDISKGGGQNISMGISKVAGSVAALDPEPISKSILAGVALAAGVVSSLIGDPRANRAASINHELFNNQYVAPQAINRTMDTSGNYSSIDFRGNVRGSDLSSIPIIQQAYEDPRHGVVVPGQVLSPFGGGGAPTSSRIGENTGAIGITSGATPAAAPSIVINNHVSAIDQDSVAKFFQSNPQALGDGMVNAMNKGGTDLVNRMRTI